MTVEAAKMTVDETLPILGAGPSVDLWQVISYLRAGTTHYTDVDVRSIAASYWAACSGAGMNPAVALGQLCQETGPEKEAVGKKGPLTSEWSQRPLRNPAGLGVTGKHAAGRPDVPPTGKLAANHVWAWNAVRGQWEAGVAFPTWVDAAQAHVGRLTAYAVAVGAETQDQARLISIAGRWRPIPLAVRGCATTLAELGKARNPRNVGWAVPGAKYGAGIATHINRMQAVG